MDKKYAIIKDKQSITIEGGVPMKSMEVYNRFTGVKEGVKKTKINVDNLLREKAILQGRIADMTREIGEIDDLLAKIDEAKK